MRSRLGTGDGLFIVFGIALVLMGAYPWGEGNGSPVPVTGGRSDPFPGNYVSSNPTERAREEGTPQFRMKLPEPSFKEWVTASLPASEPSPALAVQTPVPRVTPLPLPSGVAVQAFLLEPKSQEILHRKPTPAQGGYRIMFRFEVYPKDRPGTLEIRRNGKTLLEIPFDGSNDGIHRAGAMLSKPGVYQWRIRLEGIKGDERSFTLLP